MRSTFKILFYVRKNYVNKNGRVCIMVRIALNGEIVQFSFRLDIDPKSIHYFNETQVSSAEHLEICKLN